MENHYFLYGKIHYKWPFSIAMLNYQRVFPSTDLDVHLFEATNLKFCGDPDAWKTWRWARSSPFPIPEKGVAVGCRCRGFLSVASTKLILQTGNVPEIRIMNGYEHNIYIYTIYIYVNGIWGIPSLQRSCDWLAAQSGPSASTGAITRCANRGTFPRLCPVKSLQGRLWCCTNAAVLGEALCFCWSWEILIKYGHLYQPFQL